MGCNWTTAKMSVPGLHCPQLLWRTGREFGETVDFTTREKQQLGDDPNLRLFDIVRIRQQCYTRLVEASSNRLPSLDNNQFGSSGGPSQHRGVDHRGEVPVLPSFRELLRQGLEQCRRG
jgi:hypothetical protein